MKTNDQIITAITQLLNDARDLPKEDHKSLLEAVQMDIEDELENLDENHEED